MGESGSGKDTAGRMLVAGRHGTTMAFASKLKEICSDLLGVPLEDFHDPIRKEAPILKYPDRRGGYWTPRSIAQWVGTEGFRTISPGVWPQYVITRARCWLAACGKPSFVVVTDCRFKLEMLAVAEAGGEVWRIRRSRVGGAPGIAGHVSETEMREIPDEAFDAVIDNSGTLDQLRAQLDAQLARFFEINDEEEE